MGICAVYKITCTANGRIYVGSSIDVQKRWKEHVRDLEKNRHRARHLHRAWVKYGPRFFVFEVLEHTDRHALISTEQGYLDNLKPFGRRGFNSCPHAASSLGVKRSRAQKKRAMEKRVGRRHTEHTKHLQRISKMGDMNPQFGKPLTEKQRAALLRSGEAHPWWGRSHSAETRAKMSRDKACPIVQVAVDGAEVARWYTAREASRAMGLQSPDTIYRSIVSGTRIAAGFRWRYADRAIIS